jgi:hypothetical protein
LEDSLLLLQSEKKEKKRKTGRRKEKRVERVGVSKLCIEGAERKSSGSTAAASNNAVSLRNKSLRESWSSSSSKPLENMNPLESTRERKNESYIPATSTGRGGMP